MIGLPLISSGADLSPCGLYRHSLWRTWDQNRDRLGFIMLNPSTADAEADDQTIRVCMGRARRMGFGGIRVANLFQYRATYPEDLKKAPDPSGPNWELGILSAIKFPGTKTIAAWCDHGWNMDAGKTVTRALDVVCKDYTRDLYAIALTKAGHPKHPARLGYSLEPFLWKPRSRA
jgi:hypothetical protein